MKIQSVSRRLHIHLGLLLLFFIWLFSFTGLLLNHGNWKFASFWDERQESLIEFVIPPALLKSADHRAILGFLKINGEVEIQPGSENSLRLRIYSPGVVRDMEINMLSGEGNAKVIRFNKWGKLRTLHTFNGISRENLSPNPHWWITNVWRYSMDAIAIGLIIICLTSWIMWYNVRKDYKFGFLILIASFLWVAYFLY